MPHDDVLRSFRGDCRVGRDNMLLNMTDLHVDGMR